MPLISIRCGKAKAAVAVPTAGTQTVLGDLSLTSASTVELDPLVFGTAGTYVLFIYNTFTYDTVTYATPQACLNALLTITYGGTGRTVSNPRGTIDTTLKTISVTLT